jgi:hypothetical protein
MDIVTPAVIAALTTLGQSVVKDAYDKLKNVITSKFKANDALIESIQLLEEKPQSEGRQKMLQEEIQASEAYLDTDVVQAAKALTEQLSMQTNVQQNVQQKVAGDHNIFSGTGDVTVHKDN